ncbi:hypothetical protein EUX98_g7150 [Antrodiella citrinella]|uniref:Uncharacterized protein n=1 Tax=Antrodiella citrinella TaxID=2447956 RepID=A0A4S4MUL6_9APHY|nr:hypothetical protein EUX98_g7150 [Antrodiella citrinella]
MQSHCELLFIKEDFCRGLTAFVKTHGSKVKQMILKSTLYYCDCDSRPRAHKLRASAPEYDIRSILRLCPELEYVAVPVRVLYMEPESDIHIIHNHNPDMQVDVWGELEDLRFFQSSFAPYSTKFRLISYTLASLPNLPYFLSRSPGTTANPIIHHIYDLHIVETPISLFTLGDYEEEELWEQLEPGLPASERTTILRDWHSGRPVSSDTKNGMDYAYLKYYASLEPQSVPKSEEATWDEGDTLVEALDKDMLKSIDDENARFASGSDSGPLHTGGEDSNTDSDSEYVYESPDEESESDASSDASSDTAGEEFAEEDATDEDGEAAVEDTQSSDANSDSAEDGSGDHDDVDDSVSEAEEVRREVQTLQDDTWFTSGCSAGEEELTDEEILAIFSAGICNVGCVTYTRSW